MNEWHIVVVEGHERELRAFVSGFVADRGLDAKAIVLGDDVGLARESLVERLRVLVRGGHHAVLVPASLADPLTDAISRAVGLRAIDRHPIASATFRFSAEAFSRDVSTTIRSICRTLPAGVHFAEHAESESSSSSHTGVELYAPVHAYAYRVKGELAGSPAGVLDVRRKLGDVEVVRLEPLHLA